MGKLAWMAAAGAGAAAFLCCTEKGRQWSQQATDALQDCLHTYAEKLRGKSEWEQDLADRRRDMAA